MENYLNFLGNSQTFLGVISTVIILFLFKNSDGNFLFKILSDIQKNMVDLISKNKPEISFESLKREPSYKSVLLFSKTTCDEKTNSLKTECAEQCIKVDQEKINFQLKLTDWDENVKRFADMILNKDEQQMSPMFVFAYTIVVFVVDELLRCTFIPYNNLILSFFYLLSIFVLSFWSVKWILFFLRDNKNVQPKITENVKKKSKRLFEDIFSGPLTKFVIFLSFLLIVVSIILGVDKFYIGTKFWMVLVTILFSSFMYGCISFKCDFGMQVGVIYTRYVCYFVSMSITSLICSILIYVCSPEILSYGHLQSACVIFWAKLISLFIILFYGLICPFLLPLLRFLLMYMQADVRKMWYKISVYLIKRKLRSDFEKLSERIPV